MGSLQSYASYPNGEPAGGRTGGVSREDGGGRKAAARPKRAKTPLPQVDWLAWLDRNPVELHGSVSSLGFACNGRRYSWSGWTSARSKQITEGRS
jgi:hypothetical protein